MNTTSLDNATLTHIKDQTIKEFMYFPQQNDPQYQNHTHILTRQEFEQLDPQQKQNAFHLQDHNAINSIYHRFNEGFSNLNDHEASKHDIETMFDKVIAYINSKHNKQKKHLENIINEDKKSISAKTSHFAKSYQELEDYVVEGVVSSDPKQEKIFQENAQEIFNYAQDVKNLQKKYKNITESQENISQISLQSSLGVLLPKQLQQQELQKEIPITYNEISNSQTEYIPSSCKVSTFLIPYIEKLGLKLEIDSEKLRKILTSEEFKRTTKRIDFDGALTQQQRSTLNDFKWETLKEKGSKISQLVLLEYKEEVYLGQALGGQRTGLCIVVYKRSNLYLGQYKNGFKNGYGLLVQQNGEIIQGEWQNDKLNGQGTQILDDQGQQTYYKGTFLKGKRHGQGLYKDKNGGVYSGRFEQGEIFGFGQYKYKDGSLYVGNFLNGVYHGVGKLIDAEGKIKKGNWEKGQLVKANEH